MRLYDARWTVAAEMLRAAFGALTFLMLAAGLGAAGYGAAAAVSAVAAMTFPLATLGATWVLQAGLLATDLRSVLTSIGLLALLPLILSLSVLRFLWPPGLSSSVVFFVLGAEMLGFGLAGLLGSSLLGRHEDQAFFLVSSSSVAARFLTAAILLLKPPDPILIWSAAQFGVSLVLLAVLMARYAQGSWGPSFQRLAGVWRPGKGYAAVAASSSVSDNIDKYLVAMTLGTTAAGVYAAAYKIARYTLIPIRGVAVKALSAMFSAARQSDWALVQRTMRASARLGAQLGSLTAAALITASLLLTDSVLNGYTTARILVPPLCVAMILRSWHYSYGDGLYALGRASQRVRALWTVALVSVPAYAALAYVGGLVWIACAVALAELLLVLLLSRFAQLAFAAVRDPIGGPN